MIKASVIICTYKRYDVLSKAIDSVISQSLPDEEYEILIIDNTPGAEESEGKQFAERYASVKNLKYVFERIAGLSNARNVGLKNSTGEFISYLDDDAIATPHWLREVVKGFTSFEDVGVVGGRIAPIWEVPRPSWLGDSLVGNVSVVDWGGELRIALENEWFAGANISFSRTVLLESGGFSVNLGRKGSGQVLMSNEENEILEFVSNSRYQKVYNPLASVDHLVESKRIKRAWFRRRVAWQAASDFMLNPEKVEEQLVGMLHNFRDYLSSLPPIYRNIQGLYYETDDPGVFQWQLSAIYACTCLNLAGYDGVENV